MNKIIVCSLLSICNFSACSDGDGNPSNDLPPNEQPPAAVAFTIVNEYPHDPASFTQGLAIYKGQLYESTGSPEDSINNGSWVGRVDLKTGKNEKKIAIDSSFFGEGMTILNDKLYYITWTTHKGFVYDVKSFKKLSEFTYPTEGWGITNDGKNLIMSNGTNNLLYYQPDSMKMINMINVTDNNGPVANLNELEFINGYIYANQWQTPYILKIDTASGKVIGRLDLSDTVRNVKMKNPTSDYLNGIAYDSSTQKIYITGKLWPALYEIRLQ